jgi:hypothetical protein
MKLESLKYLGIISAAVLVSTAHAAPTLLGSVIKDYGTAGLFQTAPASQGAGSCDVMNANSVTVRSAPNCQRFYDVFDFGSFNAASIDNFVLTLDFARARNETYVNIPFVFTGFAERWAPRPASSASVGSGQVQTYLNASGPQTWTFDSSLDVFAPIVTGEKFFLWMSRELLFGVNSVDLDGARLDVYGTAKVNDVPLPGTLPLLGLALAGLMAVRLGKGKKKPDQLTLGS